MRPFVTSLALRLLACAAIAYVLWLKFALVGIVLSAPLFGAAFARLILEFCAGAFRFIRQRVYGSINGRHYAHRGMLIDIVEDASHYRWLQTDHVRKVITGLPSDQALRHLYPECLLAPDADKRTRIKAETLAVFLDKATHPGSLRFRHWLEREVIFPARRLRGQALSHAR